MDAERRCPHCQAAVSPLATFCRACRKAIPPISGGASAPFRPNRVAPASTTTLAPSARRSLVIERLGITAALSGFVCLPFAALSFQNGGLVAGAVMGLMGLALLATTYLGRACQPIGRYLLLGYSAFLLLGFPFGTLQAVFQILHLSKPEARLIFEGRDQFSAAEARQIGTFRNANPWLASWLRFVNVVGTVAIVGLAAAIAIPSLSR